MESLRSSGHQEPTKAERMTSSSGRLWRLFVLIEVTSMSSFLLSLSLGTFAVAQALVSLIHDCIE